MVFPSKWFFYKDYVQRLFLVIYFLFFLFSAQSSAYDFDNLYIQMNNNLNEVANKKIKKKYKRNEFIRTYCNSLKRFPFSWKEKFSKKYKINIDSIKFLGVTLTEGSYSPYCSVKSSSDRGVCKHWITFANQVPRISNECK